MRRRAARRFARDVVARFDVRAGGGIDTPARALSGGNMQKLILGRALAADLAGAAPPGLIVANQPTWGLDIGAVAFVHQQLLDACARGAAVLLISDDLDEIFELADRIAVIHAGRLTPASPTTDWDACGDRPRDGGRIRMMRARVSVVPANVRTEWRRRACVAMPGTTLGPRLRGDDGGSVCFRIPSNDRDYRRCGLRRAARSRA